MVNSNIYPSWGSANGGKRLNNYLIRGINSEEVSILKEMLYEAIFQPDEINLLPREIIEQPELSIYIDNWGKPDDLCLVAEVETNNVTY